MKHFYLLILLIGSIALTQAAQATNKETTKTPPPTKEQTKPQTPQKKSRSMDEIFKNDKQLAGYILGLDIGKNISRLNVDVDMEYFNKGISDILKERQKLLTNKEYKKARQKLISMIRAKRQEAHNALAQKNMKASQAFLDENKKQAGVQTTKSGLQYKVIEKGQGPQPKASDRVKVNYIGKTINGKIFDSSYKRKRPAVFQLNRVIKGWTEGIQLMRPGAKYKLYLPPDLAYGKKGVGKRIGPNMALMFEVELLQIMPPQKKHQSHKITKPKSAKPKAVVPKKPNQKAKNKAAEKKPAEKKQSK